MLKNPTTSARKKILLTMLKNSVNNVKKYC